MLAKQFMYSICYSNQKNKAFRHRKGNPKIHLESETPNN